MSKHFQGRAASVVAGAAASLESVSTVAKEEHMGDKRAVEYPTMRLRSAENQWRRGGGTDGETRMPPRTSWALRIL